MLYRKHLPLTSLKARWELPMGNLGIAEAATNLRLNDLRNRVVLGM